MLKGFTLMALCLTALAHSAYALPDTSTKPATSQPGKATAPTDAKVCPVAKSSYPPPVSRDLDRSDLSQLTKMAEAGNAEAMVLLGLRYTPGDGTPASAVGAQPLDLKKALGLFQAAAAKQHGHAEFLLGVMYLSGSGVEKDETKALDWFKRGAAHGSPLSQFWYGEMNAKGRGGAKEDWAKALPYFLQATEGGIADAFLEVGYMYAQGLGGLKTDYLRAAHCYRQSTKLGSQIAARNLRAIIEEGHIAWEPGDPGEALETKPPKAK